MRLFLQPTIEPLWFKPAVLAKHGFHYRPFIKPLMQTSELGRALGGSTR